MRYPDTDGVDFRPAPARNIDCIRRNAPRNVAITPRNWYVVSSRSPGQGIVALTADTAGVFVEGFRFKIPTGMLLWSLSVDPDLVEIGVMLGGNQSPIPIRTDVVFNLNHNEVPFIFGPIDVFIEAAIGSAVRFYAVISEP